MNIQEMKANISKNAFLDPTRFTVSISGPKGPLDRDFVMNCSAASIPGRGFATVEKYFHGPVRRIPYSELYVDVSTTFYLTEDLQEHQYFNEWQLLIGGEDYNLGWYNDFVGSVIINVQNRQDSNTASFELFEAYPLQVSDVSLAYTETGVLSQCTVIWAYHHWERKPNGMAPAAPSNRKSRPGTGPTGLSSR